MKTYPYQVKVYSFNTGVIEYDYGYELQYGMEVGLEFSRESEQFMEDYDVDTKTALVKAIQQSILEDASLKDRTKAAIMSLIDLVSHESQ